MKILILNWRDPLGPTAGGAERYVQRLGEIWSTEEQEVTIFAPGGAGRPPRERCRGVEYLRMGGRHTVFPAARRYLRRHGRSYDWVIDSVSTRPFFAHRVVGGRAIVLYHQMAIDVWNVEFRPPVSWIGRRVVEPHWARAMRGAYVISVSASTAQDLATRGINSIAIVPPGRDPTSSPDARSLKASPRLLFMGRLARQKRPDAAIAAFRLIHRQFPGARLDVLGDGYMRPILEKIGEEGVHIHGFVTEDEKNRYLDAADLMLIPSTREGWGIIAVEAAAHGVPVVAYDVGGLRDSVVHLRTGVLCAPHPKAAAEAAVGLLSDPRAWGRMSSQAQEWAGQFTWNRTAREVMEVLTSRGEELVTAPAA